MFQALGNFLVDGVQFLRAFLRPHDDIEEQRSHGSPELLKTWSRSPYERFLASRSIDGPARFALFCIDGFSFSKPIYLGQGAHSLGPACSSDFVIKPFQTLKEFEQIEQLPTALLNVSKESLILKAGPLTRVNGQCVDQGVLVDRDILELGSARFLVLQLG